VELLPIVVWTSQLTPVQRMFAHFARLSPTKTQSVMLTHFFVAQTVTIGEQMIIPETDFLKRIFTDSDHFTPNSFQLRKHGSGSNV